MNRFQILKEETVQVSLPNKNTYVCTFEGQFYNCYMINTENIVIEVNDTFFKDLEKKAEKYYRNYSFAGRSLHHNAWIEIRDATRIFSFRMLSEVSRTAFVENHEEKIRVQFSGDIKQIGGSV